MTAYGASEFKEHCEKIIQNMEKVIVGKREAIEMALTAILSGGHLLIEDVPGVAKTMLARCLAVSIGGKFSRIQCTPDLLPTEVTGTSVFNMKTSEFEFRKGPVFTNVLLADEINRATPRTQSSLLECMAENQVTIDGVTYKLPAPFMVIATQNPIEHEGTFPLPEAQLDRFLMRISVGYPSATSELEMLKRTKNINPVEELEASVTIDDFFRMTEYVKTIPVHEEIGRYIIRLVNATRESSLLLLGAGPRAAQALFRLSRSYTAVKSRRYVLPDDVKGLCLNTFSHRLILNPESRLRNYTISKVIQDILKKIPVPGRAELENYTA